MSAGVACVVAGGSDAVLEGVRRQTHPPDSVGGSGSAAEGLAALEIGAIRWVWVLDGASVPSNDWLASILAAADTAPEADLLTGSVVGPGGAPATRWSPWFRTNPTEHVMDSVTRRLVPVRAAPGPVLVRARAASGPVAPRGGLGTGGELLEWTARLLRRAEGYWTPGCSSQLLGTAPAEPAGLRARAALVAGGAFSGVERLRVAIDLAA